jgi:uncharacterized protein (DUF2141 family)
MGFISVSGTGSAAPTRVWAASRAWLAALLLIANAPPSAAGELRPGNGPSASPGTIRLEVSVVGLRNHSGQVRLCLTRDPDYFPDCKNDRKGLNLSAPAGAAASLAFEELAPGDYALAVFHDENGNSKLDTFAAIPREGFGFSRNPPIRFGPPRFGEVRFAARPGTARQTVRLRYLL